MKKKHILVISQYFYPEAFRINDMCQEWVRRGYQVTVVTGIPNYPQGKFYEGYGLRSKRKECWNGLEIIRIPLIPRYKKSIGLILNYISFVVTGFFWQLGTKIEADFVFNFETSPMTQSLLGVWYAKKHKVPFYLYVQDLWPENVEIVTGITHPFIVKPIDMMVDYIYKNATEVFVTSPSFVEAVCNRKNVVPREKVHYWPQYAEEFYTPHEKMVVPEIKENGKFKIVFTGNIGYAQGLEILPQTACLLKGKNIEFVVVGDGRYKQELLNTIHGMDVEDMFVLVDRQLPERIPEILAACDVAFLSFMDTKLFEMTIPAKLQTYMACGMPILAAAGGETERIIKEAACGECVGLGNAEELSEKIIAMQSMDLNEFGKNSRLYFEKNFEKMMLMNVMDKYFGEGIEH